MKDLTKEVRFVIRTALRSPVFSAVTLLTLALGIGANTALFSVVHGVLIRALPYPEPDRLVRIWDRAPGGGGDFVAVTAYNYFEWQKQERLFGALGAYRESGFNLLVDGEPERVEGLCITASLFDVLGVQPALGRRFLPEEDRPSGPRAVILSHGLWQRRLGADPDVLGKALSMDGETFQIVGVMPAGFGVPQQPQAELLIPFALTDDPRGRGSHFLRVLARLRPGVAATQARGELEREAERLAVASPDSNKGWSITLLPLQEAVVSRVETLLLVLMGAVGALLLLACVNVANLSLARGFIREREIAIRAALGAARLRLVRQLLVESVVFSLAGGALALAVSWASLRALLPLCRSFLPRVGEVRLDGGVLLFTLGLSVVTGVLFGLLPALRFSRAAATRTLNDGARGTGGRRRRRIQQLLTAAEVAMAFILLVAAGLLTRSFVALTAVDPGFRTERVLSLEITPLQFRYGEGPARARLFRSILERFTALAGVEVAAGAHRAPMGGQSSFYPYWVEGRPEPPPEAVPTVNFKAVSPRYFETLGVPIVRGREFTGEEAWEKGGAVILNATMARQLWPGEDAVGKRMRVRRREGQWLEVVGVVQDMREWGLDAEARAAMYLPYIEAPVPSMIVVVRSAYDGSGLVGQLAAEVRKVDPAQPIARVTTLESQVGALVAGPRLSAWLMGIFAALALALAAIGIEGVVACSVAQRTREIGVRMALGARVEDVIRMIVRESLTPVGLGAVIGLLGALALSPALSSQIFGIAPTDPVTFVFVPALLLAVAILASLVPALAAARIDPAQTLRSE